MCRSTIGRIIIKILELLGCIACVIGKLLTDQEARQVFIRNQKFSREWGLINNVTWSSSGNAFANITYGGFTLITILMLISRCIDSKSRPTLIEKILLLVGMLCFCAMGAVVLASFDQIPWELHDNSIILGCLSFFVGLLMLIDLADPMARYTTDHTQTDTANIIYRHQDNQSSIISTPTLIRTTNNKVNNDKDNEFNSNQILTIHVNRDDDDDEDKHLKISTNKIEQNNNNNNSNNNNNRNGKINIEQITKLGQYHHNVDDNINIDEVVEDAGDTIHDIIHTKSLPTIQQPIFEKILLPEKIRAVRHQEHQRIPTKPIVHNNHNNNNNNINSYLDFVEERKQINDNNNHQISNQNNTLSDSKMYINQGFIKDYSFGYQKQQQQQQRRNPQQPPARQFYSYDYEAKKLPQPLMVIRDYSIKQQQPIIRMDNHHHNNNNNDNDNQTNEQYKNYYNNSHDRQQNPKQYYQTDLSGNQKSFTHRHHCDFISDDTDDNDDHHQQPQTTIKSGFVANATKMWNNKIGQNEYK